MAAQGKPIRILSATYGVLEDEPNKLVIPCTYLEHASPSDKLSKMFLDIPPPAP